ncbi:hypothetical protein [Sphingosinicella soli]|uniref:Uncharacterized protein n=1 Tax=Sphingosinicella soli TaxID=333708 RepID=A0A7W7B4H0_9SPHN|nr:hypothetical protein [Sphingosinicella soli]MBB4633851.1 hypothetical protein [Sphingosinicella soli]
MDKGSRTIVIVVAVIVLLAVLGYALGLFNVSATGDLKTPEVSVSGGEIPEVQVETGEIDIGTEKATVSVPDVDVTTDEVEIDVPTLDINPAGDDGSARQ